MVDIFGVCPGSGICVPDRHIHAKNEKMTMYYILTFIGGLISGSLMTLFGGLMYQFYKHYEHDRDNKNDN